MDLEPIVSEINGTKHRQNLGFLLAARACNDAPSFRNMYRASIADADTVAMVPSGPTNPKTFVVGDHTNRRLLVVIGGMDNDLQRDAILTALRTQPPDGGRGAPPYDNGVAAILPYTNFGGPGTWDEITIIGHSYGGAVAMCLASRFYVTYDTPNVWTFTYGAPKYGLSTLANFWRGSSVVNVVNTDDPIAGFPPSFSDDPVFCLLVGTGGFSNTFAGTRNSDLWKAPMTKYLVRDSRFIQTSTDNFLANKHPLPVTAWLLSQDWFGAVSHTLDGYVGAIANVPAVEAPSIQPHTVPAASVNAPRMTEVQMSQEVRRSLQSAGLQTATDVDLAVRQTQAAIISIRGTYYTRARFHKVPVVKYDGQIVLVCKGVRDQKKIVKQLNKTLRGQ